MKNEEYLKTLIVYGKMVNVGVDDNGQQYFIEFVNSKGELEEIGCGTYNHDYEDIAKMAIDYERYYREIRGDDEWQRMQQEKEERLNQNTKEKQNVANLQ